MLAEVADAMSAAYTHGHDTMTDAACRLRAQKAYSTDPGYLERMAREDEARRVHATNDEAAEGGALLRATQKPAARERLDQ
jgi:hypothetical protein